MHPSARWGSFGALMLLASLAWITNRSTPLWMMFLVGGLVFLGVSYVPFGRITGRVQVIQGHAQGGAGIRPGFSSVLSWTGRQLHSLYTKATGNVVLTAAIVCGMVLIVLAGLAVFLQSTKFAQAAALVSILAVEAIVLCLAGSDHFKRNWKWHWFGLSLAAAVFLWIFEFGVGVVIIFGLSALIALVEATRTRKEVLRFLGKVISFLVRYTVRFLVWSVTGIMRILSRLLSGEFGWGIALFTGSAICFLVASSMHWAGFPLGITTAVMVISILLFMASVGVGFLITRVK